MKKGPVKAWLDKWIDFDWIGVTEVDQKLLRMQDKAQEVIIMAAIRSCYPIVKVLRADGYKIIDKVADERFIFDDPVVSSFLDILSCCYLSLWLCNDTITQP